MPRLQLFELNDQPWLPSVFREAITGYLDTISRVMRLHEGMRPLVDEVLERSGSTQIVDLCSGSGGPALALHEGLEHRVPLLLTDKFPNRPVFERVQSEVVSARFDSVDVTSVPADLSGLRLIMNAFHHLPPDLARAALQDAVTKRAPVLSFEISERSVKNLITSPLIPVFVLLMMPLVRPMRLGFLFFTYVFPVLPFMIWWDGLVSNLRTYSKQELEALTAGLDSDYEWEVRRIPVAKGLDVQALVGLPGPASAASLRR